MLSAGARHLHELVRRVVDQLSPEGRWLVELADPEYSRGKLPPRLKTRQIRSLVCLADRHGVLPAVITNLKTVLDSAGFGAVVATPRDAFVLEHSLESAQEILIERNGMSLLLRTQLDEIAQALGSRNLRAVVMKGPQFADRLYPLKSMRLFTDIDLLVSADDLQSVEEVFGELGYTPAPTRMKYDAGYAERTWRREGAPGGGIELHWDLVNSPTLRKGLSVGLEDLMVEPGSSSSLAELTPASLMLMASVHAAASHSFDRLQMLCDVLQLVRGRAGEIDADFLGESARRTGSTLAVSMALDLCRRLFGETRCRELMQQCDLRQPGAGLRSLISTRMVLRGHRPIDSVRRQALRQMLKHSRPVQL